MRRMRQWVCLQGERWVSVHAATPEAACKRAFGLAAGHHWEATPAPVMKGTAAFDCENQVTVWLHEEDNG